MARSTTGKNAFEKSGKETVRKHPCCNLLEPQVDPTGETYKNFTGEPVTNLLNYLANPDMRQFTEIYRTRINCENYQRNSLMRTYGRDTTRCLQLGAKA